MSARLAAARLAAGRGLVGRGLAGLLVAGLAAVVARPALAQPGVIRVGPAEPELRVDALAGRTTSWQLGAGVLWPFGRSVRLGGVVAGGVTDGVPADVAASGRAASARAELVARFVVDGADPARWRLYGAAGAGALLVRGVRGVARVHVAAGVELPPLGGWRPAVELGLGGGVRVGLGLRRSSPAR
ncbi:MAG TPA: hypothetical protein VFS08_10730 [Gemmatimonadaceae bacterium]|nr:hypothetical protein [Gemmatimonadaceae bacterium]